MEHRRHLLPAGGHQHRRDIHTPCMRNEKITFSLLRCISSMIAFPASRRGQDFLRIAQAQLGHHHHRLRRRGIHGVDDRFRSYSLFPEAVQQLICARRRELARRPTRRPSLPRSGSRKDGGVSAIPAKARPQPRPSSAAVKGFSNLGINSILFFVSCPIRRSTA